ncbi:MAG: hypothetical protein H6608_10485 [Flavobacteriales bacterium]|nr:hypothetical protein [Flavobacteriales bacterium]
MSISTEAHPALFLLCLLIGALYAGALYFKQLRSERDIPKWQVITMTVLRFLSGTVLCILLLNPLLKYRQRTVEKPAVLLSVDHSASMYLSGDSAQNVDRINQLTSDIKSRLSDDFDVVESAFGESARLNSEVTFSDRMTDVAQAFTDREMLYTGDNLVAQVLVTDGIFNRGQNPMYLKQASTVPTYTFGLGDTTVRKDVRIEQVKTNAITFLGNSFPVEVVIQADQCSGQDVELRIKQNDEVLHSKGVTIQGGKFTFKHTFLVQANEVGVQTMVVEVSTVNGEYNRVNNQRSIYTEVIDGRQKIHLVAHGPHPDIGALRNIIEQNEQYEMVVHIGENPDLKSAEADLVITHQLPVTSADVNFLNTLKERSIPSLMILGTQTNIGMFNRMDAGIEIDGHRQNYNNSLARLNPQFGWFETSPELRSFLEKVPPLTTPFGTYKVPVTTGLLLSQRIGQVNTDMPLLYFRELNGKRSGVLSGEGIWRWRMTDFEFNESTDLVGELISKSVQYLSIKSDKRKFRLYTPSKSFDEHEVITFFADVYNESFEFTPDAEVRVQITDEQGTDFGYALTPSDGVYRLRVGSLPSGKYTYSGTASLNGKLEKASGTFTVRKIEVERQNLTANYDWMRTVANQSGGKHYNTDEVDQFITDLKSRNDIQSVSFSSFKLRDIIDQKWLFFLLLLMLTTEWFFRRWSGGY